MGLKERVMSEVSDLTGSSVSIALRKGKHASVCKKK